MNNLTRILAGTVPALVIIVSSTSAVLAKTAQEVAEIAAPITVQINSALGDGSGVIIAKQGKVYTVLTVNHVLEKPDVKYTIRTSKGKNYTAFSVTRLQGKNTEPDLGLAKFESEEEYPVATIANSDNAVIGSQIYVYGYPATGGLFGAEREPELSPGLVTSRPHNRPEGYNLRYQAVTWSGMSGGPVFDMEGRVVGVHGQGEFGFAQTSSGEVAPIKTGFNAAVPINSFLERISTVHLNLSDLKIEEKSPSPNSPLSFLQPKDSDAFYLRGLSYLDQGNPWQAISDFNSALNLQPTPKNLPEIYFNRAIARAIQVTSEPTRGGNFLKDAIADYTKAIDANPGYADAYYNRALARLDNGDKKGAIVDLEKASQLYKHGGRSNAYQDAIERLKKLNG
jgi:V8-like Glu-specific endopeptidase